jgi:hypothetical protein
MVKNEKLILKGRDTTEAQLKDFLKGVKSVDELEFYNARGKRVDPFNSPIEKALVKVAEDTGSYNNKCQCERCTIIRGKLMYVVGYLTARDDLPCGATAH